MLNAEQISLATRLLWSLQEAAIEIEGLLLTHVRGMPITSTLPNNESTQRLAAIITAMFLLSEHTSEAWGSGESMEVQVRLTRADSPYGSGMRWVSMKPVGDDGVLMAIHTGSARSAQINADLDLAAIYLASVLSGETPVSVPRWHSN